MVARISAWAAPTLERAFRYERARAALFERIDAPLTDAMSDDALVASLRERQAAAAHAYGLLDQTRRASRELLLALEAVVGPIEGALVAALAAPRSPSRRQQAEAELRAASERFDSIPKDGPERAAWDTLKRERGHLRSLGIDVRPDAWGVSDEALLAAMRAATRDEREKRRKGAERAVRDQARQMAFGAARQALAATVTLGLERVARAKGGVSDVLSGVLLSLRHAAVATGARLERDAILDDPEDALHLHVDELVEALSGEPGAYAARVRLRREDDERWASYDAPRRIG